MQRHKLQPLLASSGNARDLESRSGFGTFGNLPIEAKEKIAEMCSFKYMGDTEYEWGASPKVWYHIATSRPPYRLHTVEISSKIFYVLIEDERLKKYLNYIRDWSVSNRAKDRHGIKDALNNTDSSCRALGWIDLNDKVMFFVDEKLAQQFREFLGIKS